ncbi:hypothetical protein [Streptomyces cyaneogriseus]|uniref:hypothetical protein n=1 Tax=Streptomyces cyaneogriseus TaxID=68192 RepID=UPI000B2C5466|nr:hypothetical protein [Streptomyces cyaneogriseus]
MSTTPLEGAARPAEAVNAEIRALLERTRRRLSDVERGEYEELLREYAAAVRAGVATAA